ncbi:type III-A CRISPR-associated RAMP protein Csm4 [Thermus igniterrae]|uniref:type III-A CRISPR-associated RAMP protein Csm4 n=1 Tax=Thermus igniterrae TaxID=88189 RepID=UPI00037697A3|nr:hypothetical protein [Thermus igniterrae]
MRAQAFRLRFQGPVRSLPRAPTLWGQLLWWYRYTQGRAALEELLERLPTLSFRLSSAFPEGWLPRPKLPPVLVEETELRKALKNLRLVRLETFQALAERGEEALLEADEVRKGLRPPEPERMRRLRVGVDRGTGGARRGILFTQDLLFPTGPYMVYALGEPPFDLLEGLRFVGEMGYGGLASVGAGTFQVEGPLEVDLPEAQKPTAFVSLSPGPLEGACYYEAELYWGRLGGGYLGSQPFKRPHLRTREGSVYRERGGLCLLEATPNEPPEAGVKVVEVLQVFPLGVRV